MKVAILGCGAIGSLFLGYLTEAGADVIGIVRGSQKEALEGQGLRIDGAIIKVKVDTKLRQEAGLAVFATKTNDLEEVIKDNIDFLGKATVLSTQNGLRADQILSEFFPKEKIINGIVMFGATFYPPNRVVHNFKGDLILGKAIEPLEEAFSTVVLDNIRGAKYLKLFINLNNCIPAILGVSMQEAFADLEIAKLAIKLNQEAYKVVAEANIKLESLPSYPKERIQGLVSMPLDEAAGLFSKIMSNLSKEPLYGSILQSIKRGKKSEIDYINGEVVRLGKAPLNKKIVELVHGVEDSGKFISKQELLEIL